MAAFLLRLRDAAAIAIDRGPSPCAPAQVARHCLGRRGLATLNSIERNFLTRLTLEQWNFLLTCEQVIQAYVLETRQC